MVGTFEVVVTVPVVVEVAGLMVKVKYTWLTAKVIVDC
jgi:hypothetical protein